MKLVHPLLRKASKYLLPNFNLDPDGCVYDETVGAWRIIATGQLWANDPNAQGPRTKKQDIETGEDQKGQ